MAVIGPGSQQEAVSVKPLLDGASEYEYVTVLNPLTDDFAVRVAQDVPVNAPFPIGKDTSGKVSQLTNTDADARQVYGLNLKNPDFKGRKHIVNDTVIKAGQTKNFKGNEAQVAVKQLVDEVLQRGSKKRLMSDPVLRREIEEKIVVRRGSINDLMEDNFRSTRTQLDEAISKSNEPQDEEAFPGLKQADQSSEAGANDGQSGDGSPQKRVGRTKKADS